MPLITILSRWGKPRGRFFSVLWGLGVCAGFMGASAAQAVEGVASAPTAEPPAGGLSYLIDPAHTHVYWAVRHFGTSTSRGRFDDVTGSIRFDRASERADVSITIGMASGDSGVGPLDRILRGKDFFDTEAHPKAYFVANQWQKEASGGAVLRGEFTLRDISRPLTLRTPSFHCYNHPTWAREVCGGDFEADLQRSDHGITYGLPFVGNAVHLLIQIEAMQSSP